MVNLQKYDKKIVVTYVFSILLILISFIFPNISISNQLKFAGFFAFTGALTNWIAIKMLFKKIPFLYGSGIIILQFEDIKTGIKNLLLKEFFNEQQINLLVKKYQKDNKHFLDHIKNQLDYEKMYQAIIDFILKSKFAVIIEMMGGKSILLNFKEPIILKIKTLLNSYIDENVVIYLEKNLLKVTEKNIKELLDDKINKLSPYKIKDIIENIIIKHLGWLIVWGGLFSGLLGLIFSYF